MDRRGFLRGMAGAAACVVAPSLVTATAVRGPTSSKIIPLADSAMWRAYADMLASVKDDVLRTTGISDHMADAMRYGVGAQERYVAFVHPENYADFPPGMEIGRYENFRFIESRRIPSEDLYGQRDHIEWGDYSRLRAKMGAEERRRANEFVRNLAGSMDATREDMARRVNAMKGDILRGAMPLMQQPRGALQATGRRSFSDGRSMIEKLLDPNEPLFRFVKET